MLNPVLAATLLIVRSSSFDAAADGRLLAGADARIEQYRKANATIKVVNQAGDSIPDARIHVEQIRHSFLFGCAAISLLKHNDAAQEEVYQKRFGELFNFATVLTYWHDMEPEQGKPVLGKLTDQAKRLKAMGIRVKGHPLILAGASPKWAPQDPDQTRELNRKRILHLAGHFRGLIDIWDVVGDATTASGARTGLGAWATKAGPAQFTADALTWAHQGNPNGLLMYNDYKLDADYFKLIRDIFEINAPVDALGLEAHMIGSEWSMEKLWETAETFNRLGKPLHFSELTVLSDDQKADHSRSWPSTPEGEKRQAEYVENMYTLLFSHPGVHAIAWWNFVDLDWDRNPGGLLRKDLSPKPAFERLLSLIKGKWWTTADLVTDDLGNARFHGFAGKYRITVNTGNAAESQEADVVVGNDNLITVRLPDKG